MAQLRISKYIYSVLFLLLVLNVTAQNTKEKPEWYSISIGTDLSRLALPLIDPSRFGWEFSGDVELLKDMFVALELGSLTTNFDKELYSYQSAGAYTRIGVDYNFMKHVDATSHDKLFVGLRYGYTTFFHNASNIQLQNPVWGNVSVPDTENNWLGANWLEVNSGMRARIINNFYLGWNVRFKLKLWEGTDPQLASYYIPGFGRNAGKTAIGASYSIYYQIPLMKKSVFQKWKAHKKSAPTIEAPIEKK